jgi:hypothetical protein
MQIGISLGITGNRGGGAAAWSPNTLFAASEAGDWFDPSDLTKMWQDTAGTTAITADGQAVARIDGQRGVVSLRQSNLANRPLYKTSAGLHWLQFDGTDDSLASAATLNLSGTDKLTICTGLRKISDASLGMVAENGGAVGTGDNRFYFAASANATTQDYQFCIGGVNSDVSNSDVLARSVSGFDAPITNLVTALLDKAGTSTTAIDIRIDAVAQTEATDTNIGTWTGNFSNETLFVGSRSGSSFRLNGNIYFLMVRGALTSGVNLSSLETFAGAKAGLTI